MSFNEFVKRGKIQFGLNPFYFVSLTCYKNDCCLKLNGITLKTLQDVQMIKDIDNSKGRGRYGIMGGRYAKSTSNSNNLSDNNSSSNNFSYNNSDRNSKKY